jgi:hypothetical protein
VEQILDFPILPDDRRFLSRVERSRNRAPPKAVAAQVETEPGLSPAQLWADYILKGYVHPLGSRYRKRRTSLLDWWSQPRDRIRRCIPPEMIYPLCLLLAVGVLPCCILILLMAFPQYRGVRLRARLFTPGDVRRLIFVGGFNWSGVRSRFRI